MHLSNRAIRTGNAASLGDAYDQLDMRYHLAGDIAYRMSMTMGPLDAPDILPAGGCSCYPLGPGYIRTPLPAQQAVPR